jgi:oligosaccharide repeat unit polymerase
MHTVLIIIFTLASAASFWMFLRGKYKLSPLWLMLSVWFIAIAISQLNLSSLELPWSGKYWVLIFISLASFVLGFFAIDRMVPFRAEREIPLQRDPSTSVGMGRLRYVIYFLFTLSLIALYLFYQKAGNFPLLAADPDEFRFMADEKVPGLINYCAQLARIFIPLSFFLFFVEGFKFRKHWDLILISVIGTAFLILFASRTQIFFIDLWVMALYLLMRKPNLRQALKFYPAFLLISVLVLAAVPLYRQYQSYGADYLGSITGIDTSNYNAFQKALVPIYVGVSFNQQALLHAKNYYQTHDLQMGRVTLDPFTNLFGKIIKPLNNLKSEYDLGAIFYSWWNTGTYLFPFVQDFGTAAFYIIPFIIAGILTLAWKYWKINPNFLSTNLYAYAMFFIVMTVYLSFTVRAEMYLDLALLYLSYCIISYDS